MVADRAARSRVAALARLVAAAVATAAGAPAAGQVMDSEIHGLALVEELELAPDGGGTPVLLDASGWVGGDVNRVWIRLEGEAATARPDGAVQAEAFYGRLVSAFWDALVGVRLDHRWGGGTATRAHLALGVEGLAPYRIELEPTLYVSQDGDVSAQVEAALDLLVTQRLVLQPRLEVQAAVQDVPEFGVGSGLGDVEIGARLRFELRRALAPYAGVSWHRRLGATARLARAAGEGVSTASVVAGIRFWY